MTTLDVGRAHSKFGVLLTASLVSSLMMLDSNIVAVALPAIGRSLQASFTSIQWIISAYVLTYAALLMAAGNFADLYGRRQAMIFGLVVFALASAVCGIAPSVVVLNLARAMQGGRRRVVGDGFAGHNLARFCGRGTGWRVCVLGRRARHRPRRRADRWRRHYQSHRLALDFPGQFAALCRACSRDPQVR